MTTRELHAGDLGGLVKRGAAMAASGVVTVQVVSIAQTLVLGRLLGPEQVGIYAAGAVLVSFVVVMAQGTLSQALIQREDDIEDAATTVFVATSGTGLLLALATLAVSPLIGRLFHSEQAGLIAAATSGVMLLHSLSSVPDALMQRAFQFKRRIVVDPAVATSFAGVAITFAALGFGAWAMVIGSYASMVVWVVMSWWLAKWSPRRGRFSFRIWREMAPLLAAGGHRGVGRTRTRVAGAGFRRADTRNSVPGPVPVRVPDWIDSDQWYRPNLLVCTVSHILADLRRRCPFRAGISARARLAVAGRSSRRGNDLHDG